MRLPDDWKVRLAIVLVECLTPIVIGLVTGYIVGKLG